MVSVEHDCYQDHLAALATLAAVVPVQACWQDWVSVAASEVEPVLESYAERSDAGPEQHSSLENCWEVALVLHRIDPAVEHVAFLELEVELPGLRERPFDQLLGVEGHPAVVPGTDQMMDHDVVTSTAGQPVGLVA